MQRIGHVLFLFITAASLIFTFPQSIFADRSCSLTVHPYISQSGIGYDETSSEMQTVPDDASPLSGAVYSVWKVGDIITRTLNSTVTLCAHHMNDEIMELLIPVGLSPDTDSDDSELYYQLADIQDAWDKAVKNETELTELIRTRGRALPPSGINGESRVDDLSAGLYVLALTQVPDNDDLRVLMGRAPVLLTLPQLNTAAINAGGEIEDPDDLWIYDVSVYPKSAALESGKKIILSDMTPGNADDRETGSTISFISYINLPHLGDNTSYDEAILDDNMTDGLYHKNVIKVVYGAWLEEEDLSYDTLDTYKELSPTLDYTVSGSEHGFRLSLTDRGLDIVNALTFNSGLYVIYDALLGPNAAVGTEGPETNESTWAVSTSLSPKSYVLRSQPSYIASYGIDLTKAGLSNASEARFCISLKNSLLYFDKNSDGYYSVQGTEAHDGAVSTLSPAPDGHLRIRGLDSASYTIFETKTESGHSLLSSPFTVTLTGDPFSGALDQAMLSLGSADSIPLSISAMNGGVAEISVINERAVTPLKAGDNGYWKVAAVIMIFGIMLIGALLIRKRRLDRTDSGPFAEGQIKHIPDESQGVINEKK